MAFGNEHVDGLTDQFFGLVPEEVQQWLVDVDDHAIAVGDQHTVGDAVEHRRAATASTVAPANIPSPLPPSRVFVYMTSVSADVAGRETAECPEFIRAHRGSIELASKRRTSASLTAAKSRYQRPTEPNGLGCDEAHDAGQR